MNCLEAKRLENLIIEGDEEAELRVFAVSLPLKQICQPKELTKED
jgi:hypothetical protein